MLTDPMDDSDMPAGLAALKKRHKRGGRGRGGKKKQTPQAHVAEAQQHMASGNIGGAKSALLNAVKALHAKQMAAAMPAAPVPPNPMTMGQST